MLYVVLSALEYHEDVPAIRIKRRSGTLLYKKLKRLLPRSDTYYEVFDPRKKEKPVGASLADDLSDIYCDLAAGLDCLKKRTKYSSLQAANIWQLNFKQHTGNHITSALRMIHWLLHGSK